MERRRLARRRVFFIVLALIQFRLTIITISTARATSSRSFEIAGAAVRPGGRHRNPQAGGASLGQRESALREAMPEKWRRGELNPCPRSCLRKLLHVYPVVRFKGTSVAPAHCRPPSVHEILSPPGAVTPPDD